MDRMIEVIDELHAGDVMDYEGVDTRPVVPVLLDQCWRCYARIDRDEEVGLCQRCKEQLRSL